MKARVTIFEVLRWVVVVLALVFLVSKFASDPISTADPKEVESAVVAEIDMTNMLTADNQMIKRLYGVDPVAYEYCVLYYPTTNMEAEELLIVKLSDVSQGEALEAAINARIEAQKNSFDGYGIEQYDMLTNNAVVEIRGNYVLFVVNANSAEAQKAFLDAL